MYSKVLLVSAFVALVGANDIFETANNTEGHLVFHQRFEAQWAMTQQTKDVFVNSSDIITGINVTDLREGKDGVAKIVSGGVGHDNVTISLKSPAVFRGFDFLIEIFSAGAELDRGNRGLEPEPQIPQEPQTDKTRKPIDATDKPVTVLPVGTGVPDAAGFPNVTQKPTVSTTGRPTDGATDKPSVTVLPVGTGVPDAAGIPTVTPKPVSPIDKVSRVEEMDVSEEIEQEPRKIKKIDFHPPATGKHF